MARDHVRINWSIWDDDDFRDLSPYAQHLYFVLLTAPRLSFCGVGRWEPARIRGRASNWSSDDLVGAASELSERLYIVVDEDTEEYLVRSFIRNDELMKQRNIAVAMTKDFADVGSRALRGVVVHELVRLHTDFPDLKGWGAEPVRQLLMRRAIDPITLLSVDSSPNGAGSHPSDPSDDPSGRGESNPSTNPSGDPSPTPLLPTPLLPTPLLRAPLRAAADGKAMEGASNRHAARDADEDEATRADELFASHESPLAPAEDRPGANVRPDAWKLIREAVPNTFPQATKTALALQAGQLLKAGTEPDIVREALKLWMAKPNAGPGLLPHLAADALKARTRTSTPKRDAATEKALGWLALAPDLEPGDDPHQPNPLPALKELR
ncbi:hypothetical protein LCL87_16995 [Rhodococcus hoagii]|nr:hypothetical protein [Prescottella equi]